MVLSEPCEDVTKNERSEELQAPFLYLKNILFVHAAIVGKQSGDLEV